MKCHSINHGTAKKYCVVCKCKYFALNTLSSGKTGQDFNPQGVLTTLLTFTGIRIYTPSIPLKECITGATLQNDQLKNSRGNGGLEGLKDQGDTPIYGVYREVLLSNRVLYMLLTVLSPE